MSRSLLPPPSFLLGLAGGLACALAVREFVWRREASALPPRAAPTLSPTSWRGRRVLITGASSGIGRACALHLASLGASIAIHYNSSREGAEETLRGVTAAAAAAAAAAATPPAAPAATAILLQADLSGARAGAPEALLQAALAGLGGLDVLVLSAGVYEEQRGLADAPGAFAAQFSRVLHTNLTSAAELLHAAGRHFGARADGSGAAQGAIVAIGSRGALRGEPAAWAYGASKAGLHALLQSAAVALGPLGVACGVVAPGWVDTPMAAAALAGPGGGAVRAQSSWGRVAAPEEVARAVEFLGRYWETAFCTGALVDVNGASYLHT